MFDRYLPACLRCGRLLPQRTGRGRKPVYCSASCRAAAHRSAARPPRTARVRVSDMRLIAMSVQGQVQLVIDAASTRATGPYTLLERIEGLRRELDDLTAAAVLQSRGGEATWEGIGRVLGVSAATARKRWSEEKSVARLLQRAAREPRRRSRGTSPLRQSGTYPHPAVVEAEGHQPVRRSEDGYRSSDQQLASALSHLQRASGVPLRLVAGQVEVSVSYVSRVLSGERNPSWRVARAIALACGGDPDDVRPLWEAAQGAHPRRPPLRTHEAYVAAVHALQAALRGLHLAAGRPDGAQVSEWSDGRLSPEQVEQALAGPLPDWPVIHDVAQALRGRPMDFLALWEHVQLTRDASWAPAVPPGWEDKQLPAVRPVPPHRPQARLQIAGFPAPPPLEPRFNGPVLNRPQPSQNHTHAVGR